MKVEINYENGDKLVKRKAKTFKLGSIWSYVDGKSYLMTEAGKHVTSILVDNKEVFSHGYYAADIK